MAEITQHHRQKNIRMTYLAFNPHDRGYTCLYKDDIKRNQLLCKVVLSQQKKRL